jgi:ammonium transporter, Amt family
MISGAIAGLGTITPASGFVLPWHGIVIGIAAGAICYWACTSSSSMRSAMTTRSTCSGARRRRPTGTILVGVFAVSAIGGTSGLLEGNAGQVLTQLYGVGRDAGLVRRRHRS